MNLLLILSVTLCIGSALLITTSVWATADNNNGCQGGICSYTWLDDNSEVVYKMNFVDPEKLDRTVNSMYIKNSNFYITSGQVIVNPATSDETDIDRSVNKVWTGLYSHILWWSGNEVNSNNITLIAWENNKIWPLCRMWFVQRHKSYPIKFLYERIWRIPIRILWILSLQ